jgi:DNA-directed RNA polymerase sigma subunit (sigma70/sigma32)
LRHNILTLEECRKVLRRIAWRIQYREKKVRRAEITMVEGILGTQTMENDLTEFFVNEILGNIQSKKGRMVVKRIVIDGYTEQEVARELNMTQQGVHKCKVTALKQLRKNMRSIVC